MKKNHIIGLIAFIFAIMAIVWAGTTTNLWNAKVINTKTDRTDTSGWKNLRYGEIIEVVTTVINTDSGCFYIAYDGKYNDYVVELAKDTMAFNTSTTFTSTLPYKCRSIRAGATNSFPGLCSLRTRTTIKPYTNGASDTNAKYYQNILIRP